MTDNYPIREISCIFEQLAAARAMLDRMDISLECLDEYLTEMANKPKEFQDCKDYENGFEAGVAYGKSLVKGVVKDAVERPCTCVACNSPEWYVMD